MLTLALVLPCHGQGLWNLENRFTGCDRCRPFRQKDEKGTGRVGITVIHVSSGKEGAMAACVVRDFPKQDSVLVGPIAP